MKKYLILIGVIGFTACTKSETVYSTEYYQDHVQEAAEQLKVCKAGGTSQIQQTNCQNATLGLMQNSVKNSANKPFKGSGL